MYFTLYYIDDDLRSYVVDSTLLLILLNVPVELWVAPLLVSIGFHEYILYCVQRLDWNDYVFLD